MTYLQPETVVDRIADQVGISFALNLIARLHIEGPTILVRGACTYCWVYKRVHVYHDIPPLDSEPSAQGDVRRDSTPYCDSVVSIPYLVKHANQIHFAHYSPNYPKVCFSCGLILKLAHPVGGPGYARSCPFGDFLRAFVACFFGTKGERVEIKKDFLRWRAGLGANLSAPHPSLAESNTKFTEYLLSADCQLRPGQKRPPLNLHVFAAYYLFEYRKENLVMNE